MTTNRDDVLRTIVPDLVNASCPTDDIATAGQPNEAHLRQLAANGYRTVVDLRHASEPRGYDEAGAVVDAGMEYVRLPVLGPPDDETVEQFRALVRDQGRRPMLVHCASANRVGVVLIPYLVLDEGYTPEAALDAAVKAGLRSRELAQAAFDYIERQRRTNNDGIER